MQTSPLPWWKRTLSWTKRILWFIALWGASVGALALVAYALRLFMRAIGLSY